MVTGVVSTRTATANLIGRRLHRAVATEVDAARSDNLIWSARNVLYRGGSSDFPNMPHAWFFDTVVFGFSPTEIELEPNQIREILWERYESTTAGQYGFSLTECGTRSELEPIKTTEILREFYDSTIALKSEGLSYEGIFIGRKTHRDDASQALATLETTNPGAVERIRKLTNLEPDWDGYSGDPPTEEAVKTTAVLLLAIHGLTRGLLESPFIAPLPDGGLELEWELDSGAELMLVIPSTGMDIRYLLDEPTSSGHIIESEGVVPKDATLSELVSRLTH